MRKYWSIILTGSLACITSFTKVKITGNLEPISSALCAYQLVLTEARQRVNHTILFVRITSIEGVSS